MASMIATKLRPFLAACAALLASCTEPPTTVNDLVIDFTLSHASVHPSESLEARLVISNPTNRSITLTSGDSCIADLEATTDGQRVELAGTAYGCLTVVTYFEIAPHDSLVQTFPLAASLPQHQAPWGYVVPAPAGIYRVRARMASGLPDPTAELQVVN
jgi:hypothetical protein